MDGQVVQEISSFISMKRYEDALSSVRRLSAKDHGDNIALKEAFLLFNMSQFRQCGEICMERLADKEHFDFKLLLRACENICRKRSYLLSSIGKYKPANVDLVHSSPASLLAVFCDVREGMYYLTSMLAQKEDSRFRYMLAAFHRMAGKIQDAITTLEPIASQYMPAAKLMAKLKFEKEYFDAKKNKSDSLKQLSLDFANPDGEDMLVRGFWSISDKNYQDAFRYFSEALKLDSSLSIVWYYVGKLQYFCGAREKAVQCFNKFLELFPASSGYYRTQILTAGNRMSADAIVDAYHRWIGYFPSDPRSWIAYLKYLCEINDFTSAQLIASEILDNYIRDWFLPKDSLYYNIVDGNLRLCTGRYSSAAKSFLNATKYEGSKSLAYLGIGKAYELQGRLSDASDSYAKAALEDHAEFLSKYLSTNVFMRKKDYKKAFESVDTVLSKFPSSPYANCKKAEIYFEHSDLKGFRNYVSSLDLNKSSSPQLYVLKAVACLKDAKMADAVKELEEGLRVFPDSLLLKKNLAVLFCKMEQYKQAVQIVDEQDKQVSVLELDFLLVRAYANFHNKQYDRSLEYLEDYIVLAPFDYRAWHLMGVVLHHLKFKTASLLAFERARCMSGDNLYHRLNLAISYAYSKEYKKAAKCLELISSRERLDGNYNFFNIWILRASGRANEAKEMFEKTMKSYAPSLKLTLLQANIEFELGHMDDAMEILDKALTSEPSSAEIWYNKAFLYLHRSDPVGAEQALKKSLEFNPDFYYAWIAKAVLSWIKNSEEEAAEALKGAKALKHKGFKSWLKKASATKSPLETISFYNRLEVNFYMPDIFSVFYEDPVNLFMFDKLDAVFVS